MVAGFEERFSVVSLDSIFDHSNESMDWNSYNTRTFHRIDPTTHSYFCIVHRTLASGRTMGSSFYGSNIIYLGMGIVLFRFDQFPTKDAIKPDHSTSFDITYWSFLGALVGDQTQKIIR